MKSRVPVAMAGIAATLLLAWEPSTRGQQALPRVPDSLRAAASRGESVRVIVGVKVDGYEPEGSLLPAAAASQRAQIADVAQQVLDRLPPDNARAARRYEFIPFFATTVDAIGLQLLESDPNVASIEEDIAVPPALAQSTSIVGATSAWASGYTGAGWTVAILDTGVEYFHPFLIGKAVSEACYSGGGSTSASLCPGGALSSTVGGSGLQCSGIASCDHGTHVAGIAVGSNPSFSGVARDGKFIAIQVFSRATCSGVPCVLSYTSDWVAALSRVYALRTSYSIAAANMSLGGGGYTSTCDYVSSSATSMINTLRSAGIATVIASGNDGYYNAMSYPGCISSAISVGSTTKSDTISSFSNSASFLKLLAPGGSIYSSIPGGGYGFKSGTSMATPHVTGAWAVMKQKSPGASVTQVLTALQNTGPRITEVDGSTYPRIQVNAALTQVPTPMLVIDAPAAGAATAQPFTVSGWAIDPTATISTGVDQVHVYLYPTGSTTAVFGKVATYGLSRPDIGSLYGSLFTYSGYSTTVSSVGSGQYDLVVFGRVTATGHFDLISRRSITIPAPIVTIDTFAPGATVAQPFNVGGWAINPGVATGTGIDQVHVYLYPNGSNTAVFGQVATYGLPRSDIGSLYGSRFTNSGFMATVRGVAGGVYQVVAWGRNAATGNFDALQRVTITVAPPPPPILTIDAPAAGANVSQPFAVSGWSIDPSAVAGTGIDQVHVYVFPSGSGTPVIGKVATYGTSRPDIGNLYGSQFTNSGYTTTIQGLAAGTYQLFAYARTTATGQFNVVTSRTFTVPPPPPAVLVIDTPAAGSSVAQPFTVSGWSIDPAAASGTGVSEVHVYVFPSGSGTAVLGKVATYGTSRPDIGNLYGSQFTNSGYTTSIQGLAAGAYQINVYARRTSTGNFDLVATRSFTVQ